MSDIQDFEGDFYDTKRMVALFYMQHVLPETVGLTRVITQGAAALTGFEVANFET